MLQYRWQVKESEKLDCKNNRQAAGIQETNTLDWNYLEIYKKFPLYS